MCKCTPEIRTPFCGKIGCEWPKKEGTRGKPEKKDLKSITGFNIPLNEAESKGYNQAIDEYEAYIKTPEFIQSLIDRGMGLQQTD